MTVQLPLSENQKRDARLKARDRRVDYAGMQQYGLTHLVISAYSEEFYDEHSVARNLDEMDFRLYGVYALFSIPHDVLRVVLSGNLPREIHLGSNDVIRDLYKKTSEWSLRESRRHAPAIYIR